MKSTENHPDYITVTHGMRGWFAVIMTWNDDHGGFYEPWYTSPVSFQHRDNAAAEAKGWAELDGLEFRD